MTTLEQPLRILGIDLGRLAHDLHERVLAGAFGLSNCQEKHANEARRVGFTAIGEPSQERGVVDSGL